MKVRFLMGALALATGAVGAAACADDTVGTTMYPTPDAAPAPGPGPSPDAGPTDGGADATTDAPVDATGDASPPEYALFVGTDFRKAELAVIGLSTPAVRGRLALADQDSVPTTSGGLGFVLQRKLGTALALDPARPWLARATIDTNDVPDAASYASNPRSVLVTTGSKAYVARYASNKIKIVDAVSGAATGEIDLTPFRAAGDPDGLVDVDDGVYDPATKRAYFVLQRIDQLDFTGSPPDYVSKCLPARGLVIGIDVTTNAIVDLNGTTAGEGIELAGVNPGALTADFANGRLVVVDSGCYEEADGGADAGATTRAGRGIEAINLTSGASTWLYQTTDLARLSGLVWADATHAFVSKSGKWFAWNPTTTALGAELIGFPKAPFADGKGRIVGLAVAVPDAGTDAGAAWSVVAWDVLSGQRTTLVADPFAGVSPDIGFGVSSAHLK